MTREEALQIADGSADDLAVVPETQTIREALQTLASEVRRKDVDADIGRKLQPLAKRAAKEWCDYNDDMALSFQEALDALAEFFGEDGK